MIVCTVGTHRPVFTLLFYSRIHIPPSSVEVQCKDRTRRLRKTIVALGKRQQASFTATTCVSCCASLFIDDDRRSKGVLLCFERSLINFENNTRINVVRGVLTGFGWLTNVFQRLHSKLLNFDTSRWNVKRGSELLGTHHPTIK